MTLGPDSFGGEDFPALDMASLDTPPAEARIYTPRDAWLVRRREAWGASEMPTVLALSGRYPIAKLPRYMQDDCAAMERGQARGIPRLIAEKAGLVKRRKAGPAAAIGSAREEELLRAWVTRLVCGEYAVPEETQIDIATIRHASAVPREYFPLRARKGRIAVTPDGWCRFANGDLVDIEIKCTTHDIDECRWTWIVQVQAQGLATSSVGAIIVGGSRWAREERNRDDGPVVRAFVEPDEAMRADIVDASNELWERVEALRRERGAET